MKRKSNRGTLVQALKSNKTEKDECTFTSNHTIRMTGGHNGHLMRLHPTLLEEQIKDILDRNFVRYDFHRVFYKYDFSKFKQITHYYIADFWLPDKKIVLSLEPMPRDVNIRQDRFRKYDLDEFRLDHTLVEISRKDMRHADFMDDFLRIVKPLKAV